MTWELHFSKVLCLPLPPPKKGFKLLATEVHNCQEDWTVMWVFLVVIHYYASTSESTLILIVSCPVAFSLVFYSLTFISSSSFHNRYMVIFVQDSTPAHVGVVITCVLHVCTSVYSGNLSREKTFMNFEVWESSAKKISMKFWAMPYPPMIGFKQSTFCSILRYAIFITFIFPDLFWFVSWRRPSTTSWMSLWASPTTPYPTAELPGTSEQSTLMTCSWNKSMVYYII